MRLIDANVLLDIVKNKYRDIMAGGYPYNVVAHDLVKIIEDQPTAYDIDKVAEQLKELKAQDYDDSDEEPEWEDIENVYEDGRSQGRYEAYHKAIEIVKKGGVSDEESKG